jgi:hypothetical protein
MWFFKRKKSSRETGRFSPPCSFCKSTNTRIISRTDTEQPEYVKTWRGQRFATCRCSACGQDFYAEIPEEGIPEKSVTANEIVEDEEALRAAEEDLKREVEDNNDRRCH